MSCGSGIPPDFGAAIPTDLLLVVFLLILRNSEMGLLLPGARYKRTVDILAGGVGNNGIPGECMTENR